MACVDYYNERALTNGVLNIQICDQPWDNDLYASMRSWTGSYKVVTYHGWGTKYDSF